MLSVSRGYVLVLLIWGGDPVSMKKSNKIMSAVLILAILGAVATLIYAVFFQEPGDAYTEFYILGPGGKATDYPTQLKVGEDGKLTLVIVSEEREMTSYRVEIRIDGVLISELGQIVLEHGERFERDISFTPEKPGREQKVEFLLYNHRKSGIYDSLYLLVDVED
jgi:uncharacterized membrane protein